jgi:uncharacterized cofD-like protein
LSRSLAVVGGGRGLRSVIRALPEVEGHLTVIVAAAQPAGPGSRRGDGTDSAVGELRRSLEALSDDDRALTRAIRRPLTINRLGRHPLGNLVLRSLASAFGDLGTATSWLAEQLGVSSSVVPASTEPLKFTIRSGQLAPGEAREASRSLDRLSLVPEHPHVSPTVIEAIGSADWVLLAPGSLFRSLLAVTAIPDIAEALRTAPGRIVWISGIEAEPGESGNDQLDALRRHGVRVDAVLYDPAADLRLEPELLAAAGVQPIAHDLGARRARTHGRELLAGTHDRELLAAALAELIDGSPTSRRDARQT